MPTIPVENLIEKWMENPEFKKEYDKLDGVYAINKNHMVIKVGLRFNRSGLNTWISGVTKSDKKAFLSFVNNHPELHKKIGDLLFSLNCESLTPHNDEGIAKYFEELKVRLESIYDSYKNVKIEITETEVVNNWSK